MINTVNAVKNILEVSGLITHLPQETIDEVTYNKSIYTFKVNYDLLNDGDYPFINITGFVEKNTPVPGLRITQGMRKTHPVTIHFCQASADYEKAFKGSGSLKGIWAIKDDILSSIFDDPTLGGAVLGIDDSVDILAGIEVMDSGLYVAIADMTVNFFRDTFL